MRQSIAAGICAAGIKVHEALQRELWSERTHEFSGTLCTRGAYLDNGMLLLPFIEGAPRPDMPETLYLLLLLAEASMGRACCCCCWPLWLCRCESEPALTWRSRAGSDPWAMEGGVTDPLDAEVPWLTAPSLEASVEFSVRKLALERRRSSLMFRKLGAMTGGVGWGVYHKSCDDCPLWLWLLKIHL